MNEPPDLGRRGARAACSPPPPNRWARKSVPLREAFGRTLARDLARRRTQPPFANSAMDGYAVRAADAAAPPARLRLIGESAAGHAFAGASAPARRCGFSPARRCRTAPTRSSFRRTRGARAASVTLRASVAPRRQRARAPGIDFAEGEVLLAGGSAARRRATSRSPRPRNHPDCTSRAAPRVAILATGDELVAPGEPLGPAQIVASNNFAVAGTRRRRGRRADRSRHRARRPGALWREASRPRATAQRRRAGDARRRLGRRSRSRAEGAGRRRHGARLLAHRDAAGQAADARPARRDARARPARQSDLVDGLRRCCSCGRCCARWSAIPPPAPIPANPPASPSPCPPTASRQDYMRATLARDGDGALARRARAIRIPRSSRRSRAPQALIMRAPRAAGRRSRRSLPHHPTGTDGGLAARRGVCAQWRLSTESRDASQASI